MQCLFHSITTKAAAALQTAAAEFKLRKGEEFLLPPGLHAGIIWRAICKEMVRGKPHIQHQRIEKAAAVPKTAAAVFLRQKLPQPRTCRTGHTNRFSRYPGSRILSSRQTSSRKHPMTGFHLMPEPPRSQWRYRSGVAPDSLFSSKAQPARKH